MRLLIINTNRERSPHTVIPLGACLVASAADAAGHDTEFLDLTFARNPLSTVRRQLVKSVPDVVGLSVRNIDNCDFESPYFYLDEVKKTVQVCRESGVSRVVAGGSAVTSAPEAVMEYLGVDSVIAGEGQVSFPLLLSQSDVYGVIEADPVANLDDCPKPNMHRWLDLKAYRKYAVGYPVQTKRGCAFRCSYCVYPTLEGEGIRLRSPEMVADDVQVAQSLKFRNAEFVDSVFNVPTGHAMECCEAIARRRLGVGLQTLELNPVGCNDELVGAMNEAGFVAVGCTAESGSDKMLSSLNKGYNSDDLYNAAKALRRLNGLRMWIFMFGAPGETEETVTETAKFMAKCLTSKDLVYVSCGIRIMPGTMLQKAAISEGVITESDNLLMPRFYFSPNVTPERVMSIIHNSGFPSANIVSLGDGNGRLLPVAQRVSGVLGDYKPYWKYAPMWNRIRRLGRRL